MNDPRPYLMLADAVLILHAAIALFVAGGLLVIIAGNLRGWRGVNGLGFRLAHLAAIAVIIAQAWLGAICPLTSIEMWLRERAGAATYSGSFIGHWLQRILYYDAPDWAFTFAYSLFGLAVVATWRVFPPKWGRHQKRTGMKDDKTPA